MIPPRRRLASFAPKWWVDVQMSHRTEPQSRLKQLPILLQELTGISGARIGDDKADVEIVSGGGELPDEILPREIKRDDSMLHTVALAKFSAYFLSESSRRAARTILIPEAAICRANSFAYPGRGTR